MPDQCQEGAAAEAEGQGLSVKLQGSAVKQEIQGGKLGVPVQVQTDEQADGVKSTSSTAEG